MAKSAVLTQPSRIFLPVAGASLVVGFAYGAFTGDWLGISLYLLLMAVAGFAGVVVAGFRVNDAPEWIAPDADPPAYHEVVRSPLPGGGAWPFTAGLAVTLLLLGLFCIASLMFFMSRILLAVPEEASTFIALAVAITILGTASTLALRPRISSRTMVAALGVAGMLMVGGGLVAAAAGERKIEHHGEAAEEGHAPGAVEVMAKDIAFDIKEMNLPANGPAEVVFTNGDKGIPHNMSFYAGADATAPPIHKGGIVAGPGQITYDFTTPAAGEYYFQCDVHPNMNGKAHVA